MPNPIENWTEDDVLALPAGENDSFERKGSRLLDLKLPGVDEDKVLNELAKQLSAFANAGGGQIIYGVADDGTVENGGIASSVKGRQSTKEWLEDVIPKLTEFEILGFNVYEIGPKPDASSIAAGKALFVVDVPDSDRAPHQSKRDLKYYVRLAGKSHPAPHRMIEDIRNRQKHPVLEMSPIQLQISGLPVSVEDLDHRVTIDGATHVIFHISVQNIGRIMARNACLRLEGSMQLMWHDYDKETLRSRQQTFGVSPFWEFLDPIYPGMEIGFWVNAVVVDACYVPLSANPPFGGPWLIDRKKLANNRLSWWLFADNAPVKQGVATMEELGFEKAAGTAVDKHPERGLIRLTYKQML